MTAIRAADARFEDAAAPRLSLRAETPEDLAVVSALVQDAVTEVGRVSWLPRRRRLTALVNRFRWEDAVRRGRGERPFERVQSLLVVEGVLRVRALGVDPRDREAVLSLLALRFEPGEDGAGALFVTLAGGAEVAVEVECLEVTLKDVSQPYPARSSRPPVHP
jgi:hypothetical protein